MKKVCVIGCFADGLNLVNGQTVKTKIVFDELVRDFGDKAVIKKDTYGGIKTLIKSPEIACSALKDAENVVILPAENGLRVLAPMIVLFNLFFKRHIFYDVVGGWLPTFVRKRKWLKLVLKKINTIFVETGSMKRELENQGLKNVEIIPNCKDLKVIDDCNTRHINQGTIKLCTFSRVMLEKGIEDAVEAVVQLNSEQHGVMYSLDIFGQIDSAQMDWFENLKASFPNYIVYRGVVPFNKTTEILQEYDALLFPTYYEGEGFAGTIIDAFAAGLPVIASDWKYNSEIIETHKTGIIFETRNMVALKKAIETICLGDSWNNMKKNCLREAVKYQPSNAMKPLLEKLQQS